VVRDGESVRSIRTLRTPDPFTLSLSKGLRIVSLSSDLSLSFDKLRMIGSLCTTRASTGLSPNGVTL
jgi:hypothetical protein